MFIRKLFKLRGKGKLPDRIWMLNKIDYKRDRVLKGEIVIGRCRDHDCIILFLCFEGFHNTNVRLFQKNSYW